MATYATASDLAEYVADNDDAVPPGDDDAVERLLERAERRVDGQLGPLLPDPSTGLKLDPAALTATQRAALSRACCASAEHELAVGLDFLVGAEDYLTGGLTVLRQPLRTSPRMLEELAGFDLILYSGCAEPEPPDANPAA
jgi:hypothetical protein